MKFSNTLIITLLLLSLSFNISASAQIITGAEQSSAYLPYLKGKRVALCANHTSTVGDKHLADILVDNGVDLKYILAPEHGFRGTASAGETIKNSVDKATGVEIVSLYGASKQPHDTIMNKIDIVVFDMQDVGVRFFTYISTLHYIMVSASRNAKEVMILDRPNPNGHYTDGAILEPKNSSFVGIYPIPIVHGMTLGELASMAVGEGWIAKDVIKKGGSYIEPKLTIVACKNYRRGDSYILPVKPSPNLPETRAIYLYPSLCLFEGTPVSVGRGTNFPFSVYGHPDIKGSFTFTPKSNEGAKQPPLEGRLCKGNDLRTLTVEQSRNQHFTLKYIIDAYNSMGRPEKFFVPFFDKLAGADYVREMIVAGASAEEIAARWYNDVEKFKMQRKKYLLYE